ncbi:MAG: APC family permease [Imperialibacter sp.]|uniref:APC family permease n=1 Tax=Imperialibacter sp. TaxID=2038411 RepID=UPI0032EB605C
MAKKDVGMKTGLTRQMGILGLAATGICSMMGAGINVVPFMIQRNVPGIGPYVLPAFLVAAVPAILAAMAYAILSSAMPRAGGSYVHVSRSLNPYLGFVASFSQWFGLSVAIGVVSYVVVPFLRDVAFGLGWSALGEALELGFVRLAISFAFLWAFVLVNIQGIKLYERTLIPLMFMMFGLGAIVIVVGFSHNQADFVSAIQVKEGRQIAEAAGKAFDWKVFVTASALLFSSFIGFDSIAQAGGEAKNPGKSLPIAIAIAILTVGAFYFLFTWAVYHTVPWDFIAAESMQKDISAPGLLSYVLPSVWGVLILAGAAIALINDLPAMILSVSRLMFAWAEDGIFPKSVARVHPVRKTPATAIIVSGAMASIGILGCHLASDFFLGIDIMVTSMLVNFLLMVISVYTLEKRNPALAQGIVVMKQRAWQIVIAVAGALLLGSLLVVHIYKDFASDPGAWYFHSTFIWIVVMIVATMIYFREKRKLTKQGVNLSERFSQLPPE